MTGDTNANSGDLPYVIVGASHAGVALIAELRAGGDHTPIVLVDREHAAPYHRPHLSKESLEGAMPEPKPLRPKSFFADATVEHRPGTDIASIDRASSSLVFADGKRQPYAKLFLTTGARARRLSGMPGASRAVTLRHRGDWQRLASALANARSVAVIGGGLIGLEVAAGMRRRGLAVSVIEAGTRVMARSLYPTMADAALAAHLANGVVFHLGAHVDSIGTDTVLLVDGTVVSADLVLAAIGSQGRDDLAADAALATSDGIIVDARGATADPKIWALGDCAVWPDPDGQRHRHESVAAASWQARCVAAALTGGPAPAPQPFRLWSTQGAVRFQMAGPVDAYAQCRITEVVGGLMLHAFKDGRLIAVQTMNAPRAFNVEVAGIGGPEAIVAEPPVPQLSQ